MTHQNSDLFMTGLSVLVSQKVVGVPAGIASMDPRMTGFMHSEDGGLTVAANERTTVVGVFPRRDQAERAITDLEAAGFRDDQIGLAMKDGQTSNVAGRASNDADSGLGGATTGAVVGGVLGAVAALVIPGIGPVVALGTLGTVLTGVAVGAGLGALAGGLVDMGVPHDEAKYYDEEFTSGRAIVTVNAGTRYNVAQNILRAAGGYDIETRGISPAAGGSASGRTAAQAPAAVRTAQPAQHAQPTQPARTSTPSSHERQDERTIQLREEELLAQKQRVQSGEVEIRKEVVTETRTIEVPVSREELVIERHDVNRRTSDQPIGEGETIRIPLSEEQVSMQKRTVVTGEVEVGTRSVQETRQVSGTVRHEELRVDKDQEATTGAHRWEDAMPTYRQHWQSNYSTKGRWEDYEPGYRYGFDQFNSGRYSGRQWAQVEPEFRSDWTKRNPDKPWDGVMNSIKHAWDHMVGSASAATRR